MSSNAPEENLPRYEIPLPASLLRSGAPKKCLNCFACIRAIQGRDGRDCTATLAQIGRRIQRSDSGRPLLYKGDVSDAIRWLKERGFLVQIGPQSYRCTEPLGGEKGELRDCAASGAAGKIVTVHDPREDSENDGQRAPDSSASSDSKRPVVSWPPTGEDNVSDSLTCEFDVSESLTLRLRFANIPLAIRKHSVSDSLTPPTINPARDKDFIKDYGQGFYSRRVCRHRSGERSLRALDGPILYVSPNFWPPKLVEAFRQQEFLREFAAGDWRRQFANALLSTFERADRLDVMYMSSAVKRQIEREGRSAVVDAWANEFRLLHQQDEYDPAEEILPAMEWLTMSAGEDGEPINDWITVPYIKSGGTLRDLTQAGSQTKFDKIFSDYRRYEEARQQAESRGQAPPTDPQAQPTTNYNGQSTNGHAEAENTERIDRILEETLSR